MPDKTKEKEIMIPKYRFDQVNKKNKEQLGIISQLQAEAEEKDAYIGKLQHEVEEGKAALKRAKIDMAKAIVSIIN